MPRLTDTQHQTLRQIARMDQALQLTLDLRHRLRDIEYVARLHHRDDLVRQARDAKRQSHQLSFEIKQARRDMEAGQ